MEEVLSQLMMRTDSPLLNETEEQRDFRRLLRLLRQLWLKGQHLLANSLSDIMEQEKIDQKLREKERNERIKLQEEVRQLKAKRGREALEGVSVIHYGSKRK